ncbi:MAG: [FeFe] hydrogenase, group A [Candidatus Cloacimonadales bacterium]
MAKEFVTINNMKIPVEGEKNILELVRKAKIDIPTFCYHSELSIYGACRLCLVDVEGMGIVASCSTAPKAGMKIKTHTQEIREMRKTTMELLLANHTMTCTSCGKNGDCKLSDIAAKLGIEKSEYKKTREDMPLEIGESLVRDPNKCILCGDCVRFCSEIQSIAAIDFANRGEDVKVTPAYGKSLDQVDCINCGQCAAVCPTGAILPRSEIDSVWKALDDERVVVAQVAPAVRVAIGEMFGMKAGEISMGKIIRAMKMLGFDKVYDTSFSADLTVIEEANEFLTRKSKGEKLPIFTSCCPGWVKYAEQSFPELLPHLSTCKSPQHMFGSVAKSELPEMLNIPKEKLTVVSIMPCTAKKYEANRPEFTAEDGIKEVDFVMTTQELGKMIKESGIVFDELEPESIDLPFGFSTGAGVIFGNSGGVSEAVLRYAYQKVTGQQPQSFDFEQVRGCAGLREATIDLEGTEIKMAIVHGIKNAKMLAQKVKAGTADYDIVEVMACPGGCIGGAGQPVAHDSENRKNRTKGIFVADKNLQLHTAEDNPYIKEYYQRVLGQPNSAKAHELLHTHYISRKRILSDEISLIRGTEKKQIPVKVCVGTSCHLRGSQDILTNVIKSLDKDDLQEFVDVGATFCSENCDRGPTVTIDGQVMHKTNFEQVYTKLKSSIAELQEG